MTNDKDKTQKIITRIPEVFADIYNTLLFKEDRHITAEGLRELDTEREVAFLGDIFDQREDVLRMWEPERRPLMILTLENLTYSLAELPMKIMSYLGAGYRWELHQVRAAREKHASELDHYVPIYALVLYLSTEQPFTGNLQLSEQLGLDERGKRGFIDLKVELADVGALSREIIDSFRSEFFWAADYIWQIRNYGTYNKPENAIDVENTLALINVLKAMGAKDEELGQFQDKEGRKIMLDTLDKELKKSHEEGREEGRAEGEGNLLKLFDAVAQAGKDVLEAMKRAKDLTERKKLYAEYGIS